MAQSKDVWAERRRWDHSLTAWLGSLSSRRRRPPRAIGRPTADQSRLSLGLLPPAPDRPNGSFSRSTSLQRWRESRRPFSVLFKATWNSPACRHGWGHAVSVRLCQGCQRNVGPIGYCWGGAGALGAVRAIAPSRLERRGAYEWPELGELTWTSPSPILPVMPVGLRLRAASSSADGYMRR
jgi:hypothetical protein